MGRYEKIQLDHSELPNTTKYRFIEIELNAAIETLAKFFTVYSRPREIAFNHLLHPLVPDDDKLRAELNMTLAESYRFLHPTKEELIHYLRYTNIGVKRIQEITNSSPNYIQSFKDKPVPDLFPVFIEWFKYPDTRKRWHTLKQHLNLFNDPLVQKGNTYF